MSFVKEKMFEVLKKAVQSDPGNDMYWVGLGNAYFATHAKAAQHAYIKALDIDSRNAATWVNLGLLYFHHEDIELANEAFYRAQVLDPDNTVAWVGQFLVARVNNDRVDATRLLEHAVGLVKPVVYIYTSLISICKYLITLGSSRLRVCIPSI
jgi:superkiller protein 3